MRKKILFLTLALLAVVLLSGCTGPSAWPGLTATTVGDVAYLANTSAVHAVDVNTGKELWQFKVSGGFLGSNPSVFVTSPVMTEDGLLIVPDSGNKHVLYALDTNDITDETPATEWTFSDVDGHWVATPLIIGNRLFAPNSDGNVYVLDLQDGKSEKQAIRVIRLSESKEQTDRLWAQPVTDGTHLFVTSLDHRIYAISLETYDVVWSHQLDAAVPSAPVIGADGMLYVGSLAKKLERFDPATGDHESVKDTNDWVWGTPVVDGDNLYFGDIAGYFYSFNTKTGDWNWEPIKLDDAITASPLIFGDHILVATESGEIYEVSSDGQHKVWYLPRDDGKAYTTPILAGEYVLAAYIESDYYLIAFDGDGDVKWTFPQK
jgi:outer membrane protein assembly factor BamB